MPKRLLLPLVVCALGLLASNVSAAEAISETQARQLVPAVAKVLLQRASTTALLHYCGQHYPRLESPAEHATTHWLHANQQVLTKADSIREQLLQSIRQEQSRFSAEKFALDIDKLVEQSVQHFEQALAAYSPAQQHKVCNHLILSVNSGEWDVQHKQAKAFTILQNYH